MRTLLRFLLLILLFVPIVSYASVFSSLGYGEYVDFGNAVERGMAGARIFETPEVNTFSVTFLADFIQIRDGDNVRNDQSFSLYDINYFFPLPNRFGIAITLSNILSKNFYIESRDNQLGDIRYDRIITGTGGINITSISLYKSFHSFSIGIGGLATFGRTEEIWETNFTSSNYDKTTYIINSSTYGYGLRPQFKLSYKKVDLSLSYSHFFSDVELPPKYSISLFYRMSQDWMIATNVDMEMWESVDNIFSTGTNIGLSLSKKIGTKTLRGGLFLHSWYYRDINEIGGCFGTSYLYPDRLGELSIGVEAGKRSWEEIEELFVRLSVTLSGKDIW